jgi:hypothetical protein
VLANKQNRNNNFFIVKVQKISSDASPFSGISFVNNEFNNVGMSQLIDKEPGARVKILHQNKESLTSLISIKA